MQFYFNKTTNLRHLTQRIIVLYPQNTNRIVSVTSFTLCICYGPVSVSVSVSRKSAIATNTTNTRSLKQNHTIAGGL